MEIFTVDAFTDKPFGGNPAAVCVSRSDQPSIEPAIMQKIAAEMNLSETAFVSTYVYQVHQLPLPSLDSFIHPISIHPSICKVRWNNSIRG